MLDGLTFVSIGSVTSKIRLLHHYFHPVAAYVEQLQFVIESNCCYSIALNIRRRPKNVRYGFTKVQPVRMATKKPLPRYIFESQLDRLQMIPVSPYIIVVGQSEFEPMLVSLPDNETRKPMQRM